MTETNNARLKVWELVKDIRFPMMVTIGANQKLFARPMAAQEIKSGTDYSELWFFTSLQSPKIGEIRGNSHILLSYADPGANSYVSISGKAAIVQDKNKIDELWTENLKAWFPEGKDDPSIALIRVEPESAEYWDQPNSKFVQAFGYVKARLTGEPEEFGENKTVAL